MGRYNGRFQGLPLKVLLDAYRGRNHINGIEGFWAFAKHKLYNYRGVSKANFVLSLKEMEWRFNHRKENMLKNIISIYFGCVSA